MLVVFFKKENKKVRILLQFIFKYLIMQKYIFVINTYLLNYKLIIIKGVIKCPAIQWTYMLELG